MTKMIDGEVITDNELADLRRMIEHDCKEFAGVFFEQEPDPVLGMGGRSKTFRATWADVGARTGMKPIDAFVQTQWFRFISEIRKMYGMKIASAPDHVKDRLHKACVIMNLLSEMPDARDVLQMEVDSKSFRGDKFENRKVAETYGTQAAPLESILRGTSALN